MSASPSFVVVVGLSVGCCVSGCVFGLVVVNQAMGVSRPLGRWAATLPLIHSTIDTTIVVNGVLCYKYSAQQPYADAVVALPRPRPAELPRLDPRPRPWPRPPPRPRAGAPREAPAGAFLPLWGVGGGARGGLLPLAAADCPPESGGRPLSTEVAWAVAGTAAEAPSSMSPLEASLKMCSRGR